MKLPTENLKDTLAYLNRFELDRCGLSFQSMRAAVAALKAGDNLRALGSLRIEVIITEELVIVSFPYTRVHLKSTTANKAVRYRILDPLFSPGLHQLSRRSRLDQSPLFTAGLYRKANRATSSVALKRPATAATPRGCWARVLPRRSRNCTNRASTSGLFRT